MYLDEVNDVNSTPIILFKDFEDCINFVYKHYKIPKEQVLEFIDGKFPGLSKELNKGPLLFQIDSPKEPRISNKTFSIDGLAKKFSNLKTETDIIEFAYFYGLLGAKLFHRPELRESDESVIGVVPNLDNSGALKNYESLNVWFWLIERIRNLIRVYGALKNERELENFIDIEYQKVPRNQEWLFGTNEINDVYFVHSNMNYRKYSGYSFSGDSEADYRDIANDLIDHLVSHGLGNYISVFFEKRSEGNLKQVFTTDYLFAAIYYELYRSRGRFEPMAVCDYCLTTFVPHSKARRFCYDKYCKEYYRYRYGGGKEQRKQKKESKGNA
jgi:hypothetical protein